MPTGPEHIGYSCTEALRFYEFESPTSSAVAGWVAANAGCGRKYVDLVLCMAVPAEELVMEKMYAKYCAGAMVFCLVRTP